MLQSAISALSDPLRAAFVLHDIEQLSTAECAQIQGITESACKVRLHRRGCGCGSVSVSILASGLPLPTPRRRSRYDLRRTIHLPPELPRP